MKKIIMAFLVLAVFNTAIKAQEVVVIKKTGKDSSEKPLMVVDGVVTSNANINEIAPNNIESINVIKGPLAKKKYGANGERGVVEITSKKKGAKAYEVTKDIVIDTVINGPNDTTINKNVNLSIVVDGDNISINGKPADKNDPRLRIIRKKTGVKALAPISEIKALGGSPDEEIEMQIDDMMAPPPPPPANQAFLGVITEATEKGAKINSVSDESPAKKAGLKEGDVISKVNDKKIDGPESLYEAVGSYKPEDKITITITREGKEQKVTAVLAKNKATNLNRSFSFVAPNGQMPNNLYRKFRISPDQNFKIEMPELDGLTYSNSRKPKLGISIEDTESGEGVRIKNIVAGSNAEKAGLKVNDIITHYDNEKVTDVSDLMWEYLAEGQVLKFSILRNGEKKNIEVKIPKKLKTANL